MATSLSLPSPQPQMYPLAPGASLSGVVDENGPRLRAPPGCRRAPLGDPCVKAAGTGYVGPVEANRADGPTGEPVAADGAGEDRAAWVARSRLVLTPLSAPSIMGMFGFMVAALVVGAWQAGWYGGPTTPTSLWPLTLAAGGLLQIVAATIAFRTRDAVAVAVHAASGSFWVAWSVEQLLVSTHVTPPVAPGAVDQALALWYIAIGAVIALCSMAAIADSGLMAATLTAFTAGLGLSAAGWAGGSLSALHAGGWLLVVAAGLGWLGAGAFMFEEAFGRTIIPIGKASRAANVPGRSAIAPIAFKRGLPGASKGQ